jgi:hypothetical protein
MWYCHFVSTALEIFAGYRPDDRNEMNDNHWETSLNSQFCPHGSIHCAIHCLSTDWLCSRIACIFRSVDNVAISVSRAIHLRINNISDVSCPDAEDNARSSDSCALILWPVLDWLFMHPTFKGESFPPVLSVSLQDSTVSHRFVDISALSCANCCFAIGSLC